MIPLSFASNSSLILFACLLLFMYTCLLSGDPRIVHRNIKAANILIDDNFEAKVHSGVLHSMFIVTFNFFFIHVVRGLFMMLLVYYSIIYLYMFPCWFNLVTLTTVHFNPQVADFGLSKVVSDNNTHVTTRVMGTLG